VNPQRTIPFDVHIPNIHGTGIAETITIQVPVVRDINSGEELLTQQAHILIEQTKLKRVMELYMQYGMENLHLQRKLQTLKDKIEEAIKISDMQR